MDYCTVTRSVVRFTVRIFVNIHKSLDKIENLVKKKLANFLETLQQNHLKYTDIKPDNIAYFIQDGHIHLRFIDIESLRLNQTSRFPNAVSEAKYLIEELRNLE